MNTPVLDRLEVLIQRDVNRRGLASDPQENLITWCHGDFAAACRSLAEHRQRPGDTAMILTGFFIPSAGAHETDGPLGSVFLAQVLARLGFEVLLVTDANATTPLNLAVRQLGLERHVKVNPVYGAVGFAEGDCGVPLDRISHIICIERAGPSHSLTSLHRQSRRGPTPEPEFLSRVPVEHWDHYHTMRGRIITDQMEPAHLLVDRMKAALGDRLVTIGVGDGGNEIGMGKIPWEVIAKNIPGGDLVACRIPVEHNIVCGVSNWGAYALAAGVWHLRDRPFDSQLFSAEAEHELWKHVLAQSTLVDGMSGQRTLTVDGLEWEDYIQPLGEMAELLAEGPRRE
jgi:hypothetical protein